MLEVPDLDALEKHAKSGVEFGDGPKIVELTEDFLLELVRIARQAVEFRKYIKAEGHRKGNFSVPTFDEFDRPWQTGCTVCRSTWPCEAAVLLGEE